MFDRFIRLQRARKALREQRFEDALQLADDPEIRAHKRAENIRDKAREELLSRAARRVSDGDLRAARAIYKRLEALADDERVRALGADLAAGEVSAREATEAARKGLDEANRLMQAGDVGAAAAAVAALPRGSLAIECQRLEQQLADRSRQAMEQLARAQELLQADDVTGAQKAFARAATLDRVAAAEARVRPRLSKACAAHASANIEKHIAADDLVAALAVLRSARAEASFDDPSEHLQRAKTRLGTALLAKLRKTDDLVAAGALAEAARAASFPAIEPLAALLEVLAHVAAGGGVADVASARELQRIAKGAKASGLAKAAGRCAQLQDGFGAQIETARARAGAGDLDAAREELTRILANDPMHEAARRELELVEQGLSELVTRLDGARAAAREGRLREACAGALALGHTGRLGAEAQLLLTDVRARMALVDRGLEEVLATLHGRAAGSLQGVRHCAGRLEELAKVQIDHEELGRVIAAVGAEVQGLEACDRCGEALDANAAGDAVAALGEILDVRAGMLAPERLDARVLTLADRLAALAERALAGGQGGLLKRCLDGLDRLAAVEPSYLATAERLRAELDERLRGADSQAEKATAALGQRDLAEAERALDEARMLWAEAPAVRALDEQLQGLRRQSDAIDEVAAMARGRDFHGAAERIAEMPPTPPMLRTRIFDMKQQLARAQGLEGAFLLRVDEGGEHLVLRGETISIGNMRQRSADLPILANVAGRHATVRRSMSFHGGMEDTVVAEDGEVRVRGRVVRKHRLSPGDKMQLGTSLTATYERPTQRSLTVGLTLGGGFQVAGTERILLMKDRGKDGRILIGPSRDVHVRVGTATGELEVFATSTGQIRVACPGGGDIDGVAFKGEHPVGAGQVVTAAGVTFVLLPWRAA